MTREQKLISSGLVEAIKQQYANFQTILTKGATQYTAEILYHVSKGTNIQYCKKKVVGLYIVGTRLIDI